MNEQRHFHIGLNLDDDPKTLQDGEFRYALNARSGTSSEGNVLDIEDILSSAQTAVTQFAASALIIGAAKDYANNALIFFVYRDGSGSDDPIIIRWFVDTDTYEFITPEIWDNSILTWTPTTRIWNAKIVNTGTTQQLFWVEANSDGSGSYPKCIDLNISDNRPGSYTLTIDDISVARKPPHEAPTIGYDIDGDIIVNNISGKMFQFIYSYVYENGEISTWSPISEITTYPTTGFNANTIVVTFNSGPNPVVKVQIARRIGNGVNDEDSPEWYIFNIWEKGANSDDTDYTVDFTNTEVLYSVARIDTDKLFELVPQEVCAQEVVDSNQPVYGDIVEGYDNITTNVVLTPSYRVSGWTNFVVIGASHQINFQNAYSEGLGVYLKTSSGDLEADPERNLAYKLTAADVVSEAAFAARMITLLGVLGATYTYVPGSPGHLSYSSGWFAFQMFIWPAAPYVTTHALTDTFIHEGGTQTLTLYPENFLTAYNNGTFIQYFFQNKTGATVFYTFRLILTLKAQTTGGNLNVRFRNAGSILQTTVVAVTTSFATHTIDYIGSLANNEIIYIDLNSAFTAINFVTIQQGSSFDVFYGLGYLEPAFNEIGTYSASLIYYDQYMRQTGAQVLGEFKFKPYSQRELNSITEIIPYLYTEIKHLPPEMAYYYRWAISKSDIAAHTQVMIKAMTAVGDTTEVEIDNWNGFDVDDEDTYVRLVWVVSGSDAYAVPYLKQDFVIGQFNRATANFNTAPFNYNIQLHKIQSVDVAAKTFVTDINLATEGYDDVFMEGSGVLELIKFRTKDDLYFETPYAFDIGNPGAANRYHKGGDQNQDPSNPTTTPAITNIERGDVYYRYEFRPDMTKPRTVYIVSDSQSINYNSNFYDIGRPQIETPNQEQRRIKFGIRWGGKLIPNSSINNMSSFDEGNWVNVSADYGAITALRQIGFTLKIIQEANYNTTYLNRRNITSPDGSTQLVVTDELISEINPSEYLFGTKHKGSVVVNEHNVYWVDTLRGMVIREAGNEPFPISNYKTVGYWRDISKLINEEGYQIVGEFDKKLGQLFLSITGTDYSETISFHEKDNRWKSFHDHFVTLSAVDYPITVYGAIGQVIVGCIRNLTHQLNVGSGYLNLFGTARTFKVKVIFNDNPKKVKAWLASMLNSNIKPTKVTLIVPPDMQIPNGMKSILLPGNYSIKEGKLYSAIKKDGLTLGSVAEDSAQFKAQLVSGRKMRGQILEVEIEYTGDEYFTIFEAGSEYTLSEKS